jgi:hypothetical protein
MKNTETIKETVDRNLRFNHTVKMSGAFTVEVLTKLPVMLQLQLTIVQSLILIHLLILSTRIAVMNLQGFFIKFQLI